MLNYLVYRNAPTHAMLNYVLEPVYNGHLLATLYTDELVYELVVWEIIRWSL